MRRVTPHQYAQALLSLSHELPASELPKVTKGLLKRLAERRELKLVPRILASLEKLAEEAGQEVTATMTTARPVKRTEALARELATALHVQHVTLHTVVDPTLVGGARLRIGDRLVDGSIHGLLSQLIS
jgi:F-type H+-transporting ATPase subunit delta